MDKYPSELKVGKENGCIWTIKKKKEKGLWMRGKNSLNEAKIKIMIEWKYNYEKKDKINKIKKKYVQK